MNYRRAFIAGVAGGSVMTLGMAIVRAMGRELFALLRCLVQELS